MGMEQNSLKNVVRLDKSNWFRGEYKGHLFFAKVFDAPSEYGIDGGRVSKLTVYANDKIIYNYDRGIDLDHPIGEELAIALETI